MGRVCEEGRCDIYIFIAGPYSQNETLPVEQREANALEAVRVYRELIKRGHTPFCPHLSHWADIMLDREEERVPYEKWITYDYRMMMKMQGVLRLPGESAQADREVELAKQLGLPVYTDWRTI